MRKHNPHPDQLELWLDVVPAPPTKREKAARPFLPYQQRPQVIVRRAGFRPDAYRQRRE